MELGGKLPPITKLSTSKIVVFPDPFFPIIMVTGLKNWTTYKSAPV